MDVKVPASVAPILPEEFLTRVRTFFSRYPPTAEVATIDDAALSKYLLDLRTKAYAVHPYPCIKGFRFISTLIAEEPVYSESILPRLCPPSQEVFLDFGCCFGPVIRRLIADGADPKNLHGADLHADYIAFGHELFQDGPESANPLVSQFHTGDVFDETFLTELKDGVDIIHITSFLHLFSWDKQVQALTHLEQLLRKKKGSLVVGAHIGTVEGGELVIPSRPKLTAAKIFRHNTATFRKLWSQIGDGNWEVDVREEMLPSLDHGDCPLLQPDESGQCLRLHFAVTRA